jgi:hypothetical protein
VGEKPNNVDAQSEYERRKIENREKTTAKPMKKFLASLNKGTMKMRALKRDEYRIVHVDETEPELSLVFASRSTRVS